MGISFFSIEVEHIITYEEVKYSENPKRVMVIFQIVPYSSFNIKALFSKDESAIYEMRGVGDGI